MIGISYLGALITFQVTFTELFIAATVIASVSLTRGWRSAALGTLLGALAIITVAALTRGLLRLVPIYLLDWVSGLLLLGFGAYLLYESWSAHRRREGVAEICAAEEEKRLAQSLNWAGVSIAAWAFFAEGLEIMVVWLAVALREGLLTATAGVLLGASVVGLLASVAGKFGIFRRIAPKYLDLIAGCMVTLYGLYFLYEAVVTTPW